jgi:hypothetical protein
MVAESEDMARWREGAKAAVSGNTALRIRRMHSEMVAAVLPVKQQHSEKLATAVDRGL